MFCGTPCNMTQWKPQLTIDVSALAAAADTQSSRPLTFNRFLIGLRGEIGGGRYQRWGAPPPASRHRCCPACHQIHDLCHFEEKSPRIYFDDFQ